MFDVISGWLSVRTGVGRKHHIWSHWTPQWCILRRTETTAILTQYKNEESRETVSEVVIDCSTDVLVNVPGCWKYFTLQKNNFIVLRKDGDATELKARNCREKAAWVTAIENCVSNSNSLHQSRPETQQKRKSSILQIPPPRRCAWRILRNNLQAICYFKSCTKRRQNVQANYEDKLKMTFMQIDADGDGTIDYEEFVEFLSKMGLAIEAQNIKRVFFSLSRSKKGKRKITFSEFYDYFSLGMFPSDDHYMARVVQLFRNANSSMTGALDFREFAAFLASRDRSDPIDSVLRTFDAIDENSSGTIDFDEFRRYLQRHCSLADGTRDELGEENAIAEATDLLRSYCDGVDVDEMKTYMLKRWCAFVNFRRYGGSERHLVMRGANDKIVDWLPGKYRLRELACFSDLPAIRPKYRAVAPVSWNSSTDQSSSGRLYFPASFDGRLPIEIATDTHLAYYGCRLATDSDRQVALECRHCVLDFTYETTYLRDYVLHPRYQGGAGLERHPFAHMDCPLDEQSGLFIIGKWATSEGGNLDEDTAVNLEETDRGALLHLTAFQVPTLHSIYVSPGTIHSNDYLLGTWRTMLADTTSLDHVKLVRRRDADTAYDNFQFTFY